MVFPPPTGYDARLAISQDKILFTFNAVKQSHNIPTRQIDGETICLSELPRLRLYQFCREPVFPGPQPANQTRSGFSYRVTNLPSFETGRLQRKKMYSSPITATSIVSKLKSIPRSGPSLPTTRWWIMTYFNIPLNQVTHRSFIPAMRKAVQGMTTKDGVDYLLHFTRYAFLPAR